MASLLVGHMEIIHHTFSYIIPDGQGIKGTQYIPWNINICCGYGCGWGYINALSAGICCFDFKCVIFKCIVAISVMNIFNANVFIWSLQDPTDD